MRKFARYIFALPFLVLTGMSCSEEISDCPSQLCVMAGGWRLIAVQLDDQDIEEDFSLYRLTLNAPTPATAASSSFQRTNSQGLQEQGLWSLANHDPKKNVKGATLRLVPDNDTDRTEDWMIESFTPRQLILVLNRNAGAKDGPAKIRFVLEPF